MAMSVTLSRELFFKKLCMNHSHLLSVKKVCRSITWHAHIHHLALLFCSYERHFLNHNQSKLPIQLYFSVVFCYLIDKGKSWKGKSYETAIIRHPSLRGKMWIIILVVKTTSLRQRWSFRGVCNSKIDSHFKHMQGISHVIDLYITVSCHCTKENGNIYKVLIHGIPWVVWNCCTQVRCFILKLFISRKM